MRADAGDVLVEEGDYGAFAVVLSVDVNIEIVRVDAQCIADGAVCRSAESGRTGCMVPTCGSHRCAER
jgi:hypothetical protein